LHHCAVFYVELSCLALYSAALSCAALRFDARIALL
jgi:hypothetical protein